MTEDAMAKGSEALTNLQIVAALIHDRIFVQEDDDEGWRAIRDAVDEIPSIDLLGCVATLAAGLAMKLPFQDDHECAGPRVRWVLSTALDGAGDQVTAMVARELGGGT